MRLDRYTVGSYTPGAPLWQQLLWYGLGSPLVSSYGIPFSGFKVALLRWFGATIGEGVRIKPGVRIKFPWRLRIGDHVWLGEEAWLDNVAPITLESHICISQGAYLCTGNHDWTDTDFALCPQAIHIGSGAWIGAKAIIGPGVSIGCGAVLTLGSVATRSLDPLTVYSGSPAIAVKLRRIIPSHD